jgi:hypothetical protein
VEEIIKGGIYMVEEDREAEFARQPIVENRKFYFNLEDNEANFEKETWKNLKSEERLEALQRYENKNADEQGRGRRDIVGEKMPEGVEGKYEHDENRYEIAINEDYLNNPDLDSENAKNIIAHEGRHATQHDIVDGLIDGKNAGIDEELEAELRAEFESDQEYSSKREYINSPSERDAKTYAADKTPNASISKDDMQTYEINDDMAKIDAYAEQSAQDFEAYEKGATNQFFAGNADKGYEEYQQRITDKLQQSNGNSKEQETAPSEDSGYDYYSGIM